MMKSSFNILLAEDNPVNQEVGRAMLESFGCCVDVASNGSEVLHLLANEKKYDVIFMDCEMPVMDGFQATRKIREKERGQESKVPVIALTAHIMDDDRNRCLRAGMDDYLSKPFRLQELSQMLRRWTEERGFDTALGKASDLRVGGDGEFECLDRSSLDNISSLRGVDGAKMLATVIGIYLSDAPVLLEDLRTAYVNGDAKNLARVAHALKSCSSNLGAVALAETCKDLERIASQKPMKGAEFLLSRILEQFRRVKEALERELMRGNDG
ncbi:MAG: response regulator [Desulfobacteraceae bacterium]|nr:response regulator [Desulfobacteraceae bacterium]